MNKKIMDKLLKVFEKKMCKDCLEQDGCFGCIKNQKFLIKEVWAEAEKEFKELKEIKELMENRT